MCNVLNLCTIDLTLNIAYDEFYIFPLLMFYEIFKLDWNSIINLKWSLGSLNVIDAISTIVSLPSNEFKGQ